MYPTCRQSSIAAPACDHGKTLDAHRSSGSSLIYLTDIPRGTIIGDGPCGAGNGAPGVGQVSFPTGIAADSAAQKPIVISCARVGRSCINNTYAEAISGAADGT